MNTPPSSSSDFLAAKFLEVDKARPLFIRSYSQDDRSLNGALPGRAYVLPDGLATILGDEPKHVVFEFRNFSIGKKFNDLGQHPERIPTKIERSLPSHPQPIGVDSPKALTSKVGFSNKKLEFTIHNLTIITVQQNCTNLSHSYKTDLLVPRALPTSQAPSASSH